MQPTEEADEIIRGGNMTTVDKDERELSEVHRHPFGIIVIYLQAIFSLGIGLGLLFFLVPQVFPNSTSIHGWLVLLAFVTTLSTGFILLVATVIYRASRLIITDRNLTQVQQQGLFRRQTSQLTMANVEDVTVEKNGILPTIFGFGTLHIETAGEAENFHFSYCPQPDHYAKIVLDARENFIRRLHEQGPAPAYATQPAAPTQQLYQQPQVAPVQAAYETPTPESTQPQPGYYVPPQPTAPTPQPTPTEPPQTTT